MNTTQNFRVIVCDYDPHDISVHSGETFILDDHFSAGTSSYAWFLELDEGLELVREIHEPNHDHGNRAGDSHRLSYEIRAVYPGEWKATAILQDRWGGKVSQKKSYIIRVHMNCLPGGGVAGSSVASGSTPRSRSRDPDIEDCCSIM